MQRLVLLAGVTAESCRPIQQALKAVSEAQATTDDASLEERSPSSVHVLTANTRGPNMVRHAISWAPGEEARWSDYRDEIRQAPTDITTFVFVNDSLYAAGQRVLDAIQSTFTGLQIETVLYVRDQPELLQSLVLRAQSKQKGAFDFRRSKPVKEFARHRPLDYNEMCKRFEQSFGPGSVHARLDTPDALIDGNATSDFFRIVGLEDPGHGDLPAIQPKFTAEIADIMRRDRQEIRSHLRFPDAFDMAQRMSLAGVGSPYFLTAGQVEEMRDSYGQSNAMFVRDYLENAFDVPAGDVAAPDDLFENNEEILQDLVDRASAFVMLGGGWQGGERVARGLFASGWELVPTEDERVHARMIEKEATIRFRLPLRHDGATSVSMSLLTADGQASHIRVRANDVDLGSFNVPDDIVHMTTENAKHGYGFEIKVRAEDESTLEIESVSLDIE